MSVGGGGGVGPVLWRRLAVDGGLVDGLLGQGGHRHQGVGLILLVHLEGLGLRKNTQETEILDHQDSHLTPTRFNLLFIYDVQTGRCW